MLSVYFGIFSLTLGAVTIELRLSNVKEHPFNINQLANLKLDYKAIQLISEKEKNSMVRKVGK